MDHKGLELISCIDRIVEELDNLNFLPLVENKGFINYQNAQLGPQLRRVVYEGLFNDHKKMVIALRKGESIPKETEKASLKLTLFDSLTINNKNLSKESNKKILYNLIKGAFLAKVDNIDLTNLVYNLRSIEFPENWISNLKRLHVYNNFLSRYYNVLDFFSELNFNGSDPIVFEKSLSEKIATKINCHLSEFIKFDIDSDKLQFLTIFRIEYENKKIESLILTSDWKSLNKLYSKKNDKSEYNQISNTNRRRKSLKDKLAKGEIEELLKLLSYEENIKEEYVLLSSRYFLLQKDFINGFVTSEFRSVNQVRIIQALIRLIEKI